MVEFFEVARRAMPHLFFLVLTQSDPDLIRAELARHEVAAADFAVESVPPERMPEMLAAADFGLSFIKPLPSKVASSPTKNAEYLAAGLPFVATAGVGGTDEIATRSDAVVLIAWLRGRGVRARDRRIASASRNPRYPPTLWSVVNEMLSMERTGIPRYRALYARLEAADPPAR